MERNGEIIHEVKLIHQETVSFFQNLFTESVSDNVLADLSFIHKSVSQSQAGELTRHITPEEIKGSIFRMKADKSPGPDGFNAGFFQKLWHIVGNDVIYAVTSFFESGKLLKEFNHTSLTLVPKVQNPTRMTDFRPISCCNLIYKCMSGILANRLKVLKN